LIKSKHPGHKPRCFFFGPPGTGAPSHSHHRRQTIAGRPAPTGEEEGLFLCRSQPAGESTQSTSITAGEHSPAGRATFNLFCISAAENGRCPGRCGTDDRACARPRRQIAQPLPLSITQSGQGDPGGHRSSHRQGREVLPSASPGCVETE
jgi:hypothetical protein